MRRSPFLRRTTALLAIAAPLVFAAGPTNGARALDLFGESFRSVDEVLAYNREGGVRFLDRQGRFLGSSGENAGAAVPVDKMPRHLLQALIAKEDRRFFEHAGLDYLGLARALSVAVTSGRISQGGSTLTQQTMKNIFLKDEDRWTRKVQELATAQEFEEKVGKRNVLYLYLNRAYFGTGAYGVEAAAKVYFNKPATELTLKESAVLVGMLPAPSRLNPFADEKRAEEKAAIVLDTMADAGFITRAQADRAKRQRLTLAEANRSAVAVSGGFRAMAKARFDRFHADFYGKDAELGKDTTGPGPTFTVRTTLDRDLQVAAVRTLEAVLKRNAARIGDAECALVALSDSGEVLAMVGGRDAAARRDHFNRAMQAKRQPGSAFKLFVYLAALERGLTPDSVVDGSRFELPGERSIRNFDDRYPERMTLAQALARSSNTASVRLTQGHVGEVVEMARRLGIGTPLDRTLGLALGSSETTLLELTQAYASVANGGLRVEARAFQRIADPRGREVYAVGAPAPERVLAPQTAAAMQAMLRGVLGKDGTGRVAAFGNGGGGKAAGGKTGTTNDYRDALFVGFANGMTVGVWVGNDDNTPMKGVTGGSVPAEIWRGFMAEAAKLKKAG
ncbi:transglycosylase domain-containing protein [Azospirillum sp.]|uniref:transglycosylase domain-containing protein n=1 Tax=Azospirillum sp. TaxID=34012 RepID=UPI002D735B9D|nr:transglycosylase domain-containing protein [Azospirillum sp.]HYD67725.1 transglycosylase domain-containing protein [Azospirillum sp.]